MLVSLNATMGGVLMGSLSLPKNQKPPHTSMYEVVLRELPVEPTGIEPVSALGIDLPFIHRLSPSDPLGGNHPLSRMTGCFGEVFANKPTKGSLLAHPLGFVHST